MTRVKRGSIARKFRKKVLNLNKGFVGSHSTLIRTAKQQSIRSLRYSYFDRKVRKRFFRTLWIKRINSFVRVKNSSYSQFMHKLKLSNIFLNRKIISHICLTDQISMKEILNLLF
jgi:large subunit ribosomal protein L20